DGATLCEEKWANIARRAKSADRAWRFAFAWLRPRDGPRGNEPQGAEVAAATRAGVLMLSITMVWRWAFWIGVALLALGLPIFSYLTLIYRELGRITTGRVHEHLDIFEAEIEPKLHINRKSGGRTFRILGHFWLAFLVLETTRGVVYFVPGTW